jgi:hypothetical protein
MPNKPVSEKFNRAFKWMQNYGVDYVMITGSDNLLSYDTYNRIYAEAEKGYDLIGVNSIYFYSLDGQFKGSMVKLESNKILGVCKTISARVLDKIDWRPWTVEKDWGLDAIASNTIRPHVETTKLLENTEVFDCKSRENLNKYSFWHNKLKEKQDPQKLFSILSEEEKQIIKSI